MKNIEQLQFMILSESGEIIFCDNALFSIDDLPSTSVFEWSPFVESIFPNLLKEDRKIYTFEKVRTIHDFLNGTYDYSFYKNDGKNNSNQIIWIISDCSKYYDELTREQQLRNQKIIEKQLNLFRKNTLPTLELISD